jgi:hypothetical protein
MESETTEVATGFGFLFIIEIALLALVIIGLWKLFAKAGKPGWAAIIPIYNTCMLIDIAGKPIWWILLMFIPIVNLVITILVMIGLAQNFGRGTGTVLGLIFLPMIFLLILGFGSAEYNKVEG